MNRYLDLILVLASAALFAGAQPSTPTFDAASIHPLKDSQGAFHYNITPGRIDAKDMNLRFLIQDAWNIPEFELSGPPSITSHHVDLVATAPASTSRADLRLMLRNLLIERFHLATHEEKRVQAIYRLEVLPKGANLTSIETGPAEPNSPMMDRGSITLSGSMTMRQLAQRITRFAGKPVLDATDFEGYFKVNLTFAADDAPLSGDNIPAPQLTKAVQEQLGLKLVPVTAPVTTLVVDHIDDTPTEN